jgi:hypothetical protein
LVIFIDTIFEQSIAILSDPTLKQISPNLDQNQEYSGAGLCPAPLFLGFIF